MYVRVEGDCGLLEELLGRVWGGAAAGDPLEALLGVLAEKALRCSIRLAVGELSLEVGDHGSGRVFRVTARGAPVDALLRVKSVCGRRAW
ncbi:hypothetical protein [Pyrodictium abyssi]|uniref:Uncharacterized protein n=1 Tax=Pyrodictium abyssi TaxID=54256 RepID=A0ABM8IY49_9CREN|nr:hypothetical protein PABY_11190 [Pyrodictium abyssi]